MGKMTFEEKLRNYAELIVCHGLNVQEGQLVNIVTEAYHRDFALLVAEVAYERGAKYVNLDLSDPRLGRLRILKSSNSNLEYVPEFISVKYRELVSTTAANLKIVGSEEPDILSDLDPKKINITRLHLHNAIKEFYEEGIGKSLVHWTIAAAATPKWGLKVFPQETANNACERLWEEIFKICRCDKSDCLEEWRVHNAALQKRAAELNKLQIKELHFSGGGNDLRVVLSPKAMFKGGSDRSPRQVEFEPNLPTEEVFTTPDYRGTQGYVKATRPFLINGKLIENLELEFDKGKIVSFSASSGKETFEEYINSDPGACRLGEVALVGIDSPVYKSGLVFEEILFDENAACHIAIGLAYKFCLKGGEKMSQLELEEIGCNISTVHTDMMISSAEVGVTATTYQGEKILLIEKGAWVL